MSSALYSSYRCAETSRPCRDGAHNRRVLQIHASGFPVFLVQRRGCRPVVGGIHHRGCTDYGTVAEDCRDSDARRHGILHAHLRGPARLQSGHGLRMFRGGCASFSSADIHQEYRARHPVLCLILPLLCARHSEEKEVCGLLPCLCSPRLPCDILAALHPPVDFTGYSASARLEASEHRASRSLAIEDEYEAVFIYEKNGRTREFTLDDLPIPPGHSSRPRL